MVYLIILGVTFFIQLLAASWYSLAKTKNMKDTFKYKMLCSCIYVADILLCGAMANAFNTIYYYIILSGTLLTFIGDILQDKLKPDSVFSALRAFSSLCFLCAVLHLTQSRFGLSVFARRESLIAIGISILIFSILLFTDKSIRKGSLFTVSSSFLFFVLSLVCGIQAQNTGIPEMQTLSFILIVGSLGVFCSDYLYFGSRRQQKQLLRTNLYYFGLMIFACSVASV